ncbi:MAG: PhzF family phenazine biosynthesis protein [Chitinophagaceae bacterium]
MQMKFYQADAFTSVAFRGNPAAVCILDQDIPDSLKQSVAAENNVSDTAFLRVIPDGYALQWFTPTTEVPLCGHATLASAHILWEQGIWKGDTLRFQTKSGLLTATRQGDWIELNFPSYSTLPVTLPKELAKLLPVNLVGTFLSADRYLIELNSEEELKGYQPNYLALGQFYPIILTCKPNEGSPYDFISRFFAPSHGVNEDPVTGSAHCCLAPYWAAKLRKNELFAYQASSRGGELRLIHQGERVSLAGQAITVICGKLQLPNGNQ